MDIVIDKSFKYDLENINSKSDEHKFVKDFFHTTFNGLFKRQVKFKEFTLFKVIENDPMTANSKNNLMLFHGTNKEGVVGILKEGFKNSPKGWFGQGVYMTECSGEALVYSHLHTAENDPDDGSDYEYCSDDDSNGYEYCSDYSSDDSSDYEDCSDYDSDISSNDDDCSDDYGDDDDDDDTESYRYVFVNEVLESHNLQATEYEFPATFLPKDVDTKHENKFNMFKTKNVPLPIDSNYKKDNKGRKYRNVEHYGGSFRIEYLADESVTIPRYLIVVVK